MKPHAFFLPTKTLTLQNSTTGQIVLGVALMLWIVLAISTSAAQAQTYIAKNLHDFEGAPIDGAFADGTPINVNGTVYGTTASGGDDSNGSIYSISPNGSGFSMLYSFSPLSSGINTDGANPTAGLINVSGILYGTTYNGGANGFGTVFSFDPATDIETAIYSFAGGITDGAGPHASLVLLNGLLYGTTEKGGANNQGTVFSIDPSSHAVQLIYSFGGGGDGASPDCSLTAVNGILYGTTFGGNSLGYGIVFSLDPATKTEHVLHYFTGTDLNSDGAHPGSSLIAINGTLYGTTYQGGTGNVGTIFSLKTDGSSYQPLYSFQATSSTDGAQPVPGLISLNGTLYGTTNSGGLGSGTVFSFDPSTKAETTLYEFSALDGSGDNVDGANPYAGLLSINGTFYGTTNSGGAAGHGVIFSLTPATVPIAKNDSGRGIANHTIIVGAPGVLGNDNNGGDPMTSAAVVANPTHGSLNFHSDGSFTYTPSTNFVGTDSFTYKDTNSVGASNTATCTLTIGPIAYNDAGRTYFNTAVTIGAPGVLANDVTGGLTTTASLVTNPSHGTIAFNSNGGFTYTPNSGFLGTDSFTYKITDAGGTSAPATCTMTVQARTPVANNDSGRVTHNTTLTITAPGVLGNDNPGSTGTVTAAIVTNPTHGTITFNSNGSFVYKPTTGFIGTDSFTYKDTNSVGTSNTATCTLTVQ